MLSRLLRIAVFALLFVATPAHAYDPEFSKVVSYSKLMSLSPAKRLEYLRQLRLIVGEFEQLQKNLSKDSPRVAERSFILDMLIREAEAAVLIDDWGDTASYYRCPSLYTQNPKVKALLARGGKAQCFSRAVRSCFPGYVDVGTVDGKQRICFKPPPRAKSKIQKIAASKPKRRFKGARKGKSTTEQLETAMKDLTDDADEGLAPIEAEDDHHVARDLPEFTLLTDRDQMPDMENTDATPAEECKDKPSIEPPASCTPQSVKAAKQAFYQDKSPHCLYGGNFSHYANLEKRPGNCQVPTEFCLSSLTCKDAHGARINPNENIRIKCSGAGEALCNPYIFNLNENDQALCVPKGPDATQTCYDRSNEVQAKLGDKYYPFIQRVKMSGSANAQDALTGVFDGWNEYADAMNDLCTKSPTQDLYCRECQILKRRIADLNLSILGSRKPDANGNCYYFRHIGIKNDDAAPSGAKSSGSQQ